MINNKSIYPKTQRVKCIGANIYITEKLDGSNLVLFKLNGELHFAQRNNIFNINELEEVKDKLYKGLYQWLLDHKEELQAELHENSAICRRMAWNGANKILC